MQVKFEGFRFGNATKELANGEALGPALRAFGVDTAGVAVLVNGTRVEEQDLNRFHLRDGDVVKATVKAIGGTEEGEQPEQKAEGETAPATQDGEGQ